MTTASILQSITSQPPLAVLAVGVLTVIGNLLVSILTIFGSGVVVHKMSASKAEREFKLFKLEALHESIDRFTLLLERVLSEVIATTNQQRPLDTLETTVHELTNSPHFAKIEMIVKIYFPKLIPVFDDYYSVLHTHADNIENAVSEQDPDKRKSLFDRIMTRTNMVATNFNRAIYAEAKRLQ